MPLFIDEICSVAWAYKWKQSHYIAFQLFFPFKLKNTHTHSVTHTKQGLDFKRTYVHDLVSLSVYHHVSFYFCMVIIAYIQFKPQCVLWLSCSAVPVKSNFMCWICFQQLARFDLACIKKKTVAQDSHQKQLASWVWTATTCWRSLVKDHLERCTKGDESSRDRRVDFSLDIEL